MFDTPSPHGKSTKRTVGKDGHGQAHDFATDAQFVEEIIDLDDLDKMDDNEIINKSKGRPREEEVKYAEYRSDDEISFVEELNYGR